jgi:hypothetical protein
MATPDDCELAEAIVKADAGVQVGLEGRRIRCMVVFRSRLVFGSGFVVDAAVCGRVGGGEGRRPRALLTPGCFQWPARGLAAACGRRLSSAAWLTCCDALRCTAWAAEPGMLPAGAACAGQPGRLISSHAAALPPPQKLLKEQYGIHDVAMVACDPWSGEAARAAGRQAGAAWARCRTLPACTASAAPQRHHPARSGCRLVGTLPAQRVAPVVHGFPPGQHPSSPAPPPPLPRSAPGPAGGPPHPDLHVPAQQPRRQPLRPPAGPGARRGPGPGQGGLLCGCGCGCGCGCKCGCAAWEAGWSAEG